MNSQNINIMQPLVVIQDFNADTLMRNIEAGGRVAYKSEGKKDDNSHERLIRQLIKSGHTSVLEHESIRARFIYDRGVSHEKVRHRHISPTQESTRYVNYSSSRNENGTGINVIEPFFFVNRPEQYEVWLEAMINADASYQKLISLGASPQEARSVLPNSTKTEIVVTCNCREWRQVFFLRAAKPAHPQMRQVMIPMLIELQKKVPALFDDLDYDTAFPIENYAQVIWADSLI